MAAAAVSQRSTCSAAGRPARRCRRAAATIRADVSPTLQPGLENRTAPSWLAEPIRHVVKSQQFNKESLEHVLKASPGAADE